MDAEVARSTMEKLVPYAAAAFFSPQPAPAFAEPEMEGLNAYVMLNQDEAIPLPAQEAMVQTSGHKWTVKRLDASHLAPFLTKTEEMVKIVDELMSTFEQRLES